MLPRQADGGATSPLQGKDGRRKILSHSHQLPEDVTREISLLSVPPHGTSQLCLLHFQMETHHL